MNIIAGEYNSPGAIISDKIINNNKQRKTNAQRTTPTNK